MEGGRSPIDGWLAIFDPAAGLLARNYLHHAIISLQ